ncbi:MAG TPA: hypothetical protein VMS22_17260 [Candidatus Eisenbacteria bacterium]|nr:hypothetical protein [Candidatus Eisenbacteria bacterium]
MSDLPTTIEGLAEAAAILGKAVLGPADLTKALGYDPLPLLSADEHRAVARVPFGKPELERARADGEVLVLRVPRDPDGPLTMLALGRRLHGGLDPKVHKGVGYSLRDEWTIDTQPFATTDSCAAGWYLVRREPLPATRNRGYRAQDDALAALGLATKGRPHRRSAVEIAFDTLVWHRARGERLLATAWDWSRSPSNDQGFAALGEFGEQGLGVIAYSRAVRFGTLGVCPQR